MATNTFGKSSNTLNSMSGPYDNSFITGGISGGPIHHDTIDGYDRAQPVKNFVIPEEGHVQIGDFVMTGNEFKTCMMMLHKMAMKECPEEFI